MRLLPHSQLLMSIHQANVKLASLHIDLVVRFRLDANTFRACTTAPRNAQIQ